MGLFRPYERPKRKIGLLSDIDGLRAVAVLVVVLFHLKVPGFEGGYIGVDIFFVISGFLITGLIQERMADESFKLSGFYANRARRLLPAIIATVLLTSAASIVMLQPQMLGSYARSALASLLSFANLVFFFESGYWDSAAEQKPLLHLWSLGVEEQFYLIWPLILVGLTQLRHSLYLHGVLQFFAVSLFACIYYTPVNSAATFYLIPFRAWQFLLGVIALEIWRHSRLNLFSNQVLRSTGLALCCMGVYLLADPSAFPGWQALIPSLGAALVLVACSNNDPSPVLSNAPASWLGRVSYSMYLVHWPPIALYHAYTLSELTYGVSAALGALTVLLTLLLHHQVERRFYKRTMERPTGWGVAPRRLAGLVMALCILFVLMHDNPDRFSKYNVTLTAETVEKYKQGRFRLVRGHCRVDLLDNPRRCSDPRDRDVLFIGNSHEADGFNVLAAALPDNSRESWVRFGSTGDCGQLKVVEGWVTSSSADCQRRLDQLYASIEVQQWHTVIYSARHPGFADKLPLITVLEAMKQQIPSLSIIVVEDYISTTKDCASIINQSGDRQACGYPRNVRFFPGMERERDIYRRRLETLASGWISKKDLLCSSGEVRDCQVVSPEGHPMFVDQHHLTFEFAVYVGKLVRQQNPEWLQAIR